jgi:hypothetical protein
LMFSQDLFKCFCPNLQPVSEFNLFLKPTSVLRWSQLPRAVRRGLAVDCLLGLKVRI